MYFLSEEEKKRLLRYYLPLSRQSDVADELRGWNWHQPPLSPVYDVRLALYEVANRYCPTGRDLYLRRVLGVKAKPSPAMIKGRIFHEAMVRLLVRAKRLIYTHGVFNYRGILNELMTPLAWDMEEYRSQLPQGEFEDVKQKVEALAAFENARLTARIQEILVKQPHIGEDSLVALAVPIVTEQKLDGTFLGLSPNLSADAFMVSEPIIVDLKWGEPQKFHRLTTTGYALVMEAISEFPVNIGCLVYAQFKKDRLHVTKDIHIINDELRQWFIEERDEKMRLVAEEIDPGHTEECNKMCYCYEACKGD